MRFECDSTNFRLVEGVLTLPLLIHLSPVLSTHLVLFSCVHTVALWGPTGAQQCLSLARGVCTLTSLKIPEDRFRTRVSDRLPWKDLGQTSQNKTTRKVQQHYRTHPILFPTWMYNRKRTPYTKEEGTQILNRVKNQLTLEQAERTRKRVEELNRSVQLEPKASTDTTAHPERDTQLLVHSSSSTEEREKDLQQPSWLTSRFVPFTHSCLISVRTKPWIHLIT